MRAVCTCVVLVHRFREESICLGLLRGIDHLLKGAVLQAVLDVVPQRTREQLQILGHQGQLTGNGNKGINIS